MSAAAALTANGDIALCKGGEGREHSETEALTIAHSTSPRLFKCLLTFGRARIT